MLIAAPTDFYIFYIYDFRITWVSSLIQIEFYLMNMKLGNIRSIKSSS